MALFLPIAGELSGSIGANTWAHNKGGPYVRQRGIPTNPQSTKQMAIRTILAFLSGQWQVLTDNQRDAWNLYAQTHPVINRLGQAQKLSGHQTYVALNCRLLQAGAAAQSDPPVGAGPTPLVTFSFVASSPHSIVITFTTTPLPANYRLVMWQTKPGSLGRQGSKRAAQLIGYGPVTDASPTTFATGPTAAVGQASNVYVSVMDPNGRISVPQMNRVIYV